METTRLSSKDQVILTKSMWDSHGRTPGVDFAEALTGFAHSIPPLYRGRDKQGATSWT